MAAWRPTSRLLRPRRDPPRRRERAGASAGVRGRGEHHAPGRGVCAVERRARGGARRDADVDCPPLRQDAPRDCQGQQARPQRPGPRRPAADHSGRGRPDRAPRRRRSRHAAGEPAERRDAAAHAAGRNADQQRMAAAQGTATARLATPATESPEPAPAAARSTAETTGAVPGFRWPVRGRVIAGLRHQGERRQRTTASMSRCRKERR